MKKKYLGLIEELNPKSEQLTDDPDIAAKQNEVVNQKMFELARIKKIAKYVEMDVSAGDVITSDDIGGAVGYDLYQRGKTCGVKYEEKANGTVLKILEDGTLEVDCFVYPERITEKTKDANYEFELSPDVLEIMPYGIAADLLKSDVSAEYGKVYANEYEKQLTRIDPRESINGIRVKGGVII
jgi:hypothetical protein